MFDTENLSKFDIYNNLMHCYTREELRSICRKHNIRRGQNKRATANNIIKAVGENKIKLRMKLIFY